MTVSVDITTWMAMKDIHVYFAKIQENIRKSGFGEKSKLFVLALKSVALRTRNISRVSALWSDTAVEHT